MSHNNSGGFSIKLLCLGSSDAFNSSGKRNSSFLLDVADVRILIDCGPTTLQALKSNGISTNEIEIILCSHFHGDHIVGIPFILLDSLYIAKRTNPLTIIGPKGIKRKITELYEFLYPSVSLRDHHFDVNYIEMDSNEELTLNKINIKSYAMKHQPESLGYKVNTENQKIAYTGDTGYNDNIIPLIKDTDVSIIECSFFNYQLESHISYDQVESLMKYSKLIILTHLGEDVRKNLENDSLPESIIVADDDFVFEI